MKGAAMKLGQVMSFLDVGLVPEEHREEFQRKLGELRDAAPKVRFSDMRKVMESELGESLEEAFEAFDSEPIAAASIGQVYRARLHDGRDVAVKVQYPGVAQAVRADMQNLGIILRLMKRIAPGLDVKSTAEEIRDADRRRARLRARGPEPAHAGAHLPRPPVHPRARGRHLAVARAGAGQRVRHRPRLRRHQGARPGHARPRRRDHLPLLLRLHVPPPAVLRRPAPGQLPAPARRQRRVPGLRAVQGDAGRADRDRARVPARRPRGRRRAAARDLQRAPGSCASPTASGPTSCSPSSSTPPGGTCSTRRSTSSPRSPPR